MQSLIECLLALLVALDVQTTAPPLHFVTVTAGADHVCALTDHGETYCWGSNEFGQLGIGAADASPHTKPVRVGGGLTVTALAACALTRDGTAYCWRANADGEIGDGTRQDEASPQRVSTNRRFSSITAGGNLFVAKAGDVATWGFTCGLTADDGSIVCWGDNRHGALGNGSTDRAATPTPIAKP